MAKDILGQYAERPPADLDASAYHHRVSWGNWPSFVALIKEHGIFVPLLCRWIGGDTGYIDDGGLRLEVIDGHRRRKAAEEAGLALVPIMIVDLSDEEVIEKQAILNLEHAGSHPLDQCVAYHHLIDLGHTEKSLAERFGRDLDEVRDRIALVRLPVEGKARKLYVDGKISDEAARLLCRLSLAKQQDDLAKLLADGSMNDSMISTWIRQHALVSLATVPWGIEDSGFKAGACLPCPKMTGAGAVQRTMFEAIVAGKDRHCTDPGCFQGKMKESTKALRAGLGDAVEDLDAKPAETFIMSASGRYVPIPSTGFVECEDDCPIVPGRTWTQAAAAAGYAGKPTWAVDQDGRGHALYVKSKVATLIRKSVNDTTDEAKEGNRAVEQAADPAREAARERAAALDKALKAILQKIIATDSDRPCAEEVMGMTLPLIGAKARRAVAEALDVHSDELENIAKVSPDSADHDRVLRITLALLVAEAGIADPTPATKAIAKRVHVKIPTPT